MKETLAMMEARESIKTDLSTEHAVGCSSDEASTSGTERVSKGEGSSQGVDLVHWDLTDLLMDGTNE